MVRMKRFREHVKAPSSRNRSSTLQSSFRIMCCRIAGSSPWKAPPRNGASMGQSSRRFPGEGCVVEAPSDIDTCDLGDWGIVCFKDGQRGFLHLRITIFQCHSFCCTGNLAICHSLGRRLGALSFRPNTILTSDAKTLASIAKSGVSVEGRQLLLDPRTERSSVPCPHAGYIVRRNLGCWNGAAIRLASQRNRRFF